MLSVNNLTKKYGKNLACDNVTFTLESGTVTVLLGPNGAGKSTLIKSIIGFLRYTGTVFVDGIPNKTVESKRLLGYIPEIPSLYPNLAVGEHMEFIARAYKLRDYKEYKNFLLDKFELSDKVKKFGDELSKGMQQKLNLCLGLLPRPRVLLLDEPMIGLDPKAIKELKSYIEELRGMGVTIFVSTHIIDSIDMLWDRALIMKNGKICADVTRGSLESDGISLEELFFKITENKTNAPLSSEDSISSYNFDGSAQNESNLSMKGSDESAQSESISKDSYSSEDGSQNHDKKVENGELKNSVDKTDASGNNEVNK